MAVPVRKPVVQVGVYKFGPRRHFFIIVVNLAGGNIEIVKFLRRVRVNVGVFACDLVFLEIREEDSSHDDLIVPFVFKGKALHVIDRERRRMGDVFRPSLAVGSCRHLQIGEVAIGFDDGIFILARPFRLQNIQDSPCPNRHGSFSDDSFGAPCPPGIRVLGFVNRVRAQEIIPHQPDAGIVVKVVGGRIDGLDVDRAARSLGRVNVEAQDRAAVDPHIRGISGSVQIDFVIFVAVRKIDDVFLPICCQFRKLAHVRVHQFRKALSVNLIAVGISGSQNNVAQFHIAMRGTHDEDDVARPLVSTGLALFENCIVGIAAVFVRKSNGKISFFAEIYISGMADRIRNVFAVEIFEHSVILRVEFPCFLCPCFRNQKHGQSAGKDDCKNFLYFAHITSLFYSP